MLLSAHPAFIYSTGAPAAAPAAAPAVISLFKNSKLVFTNQILGRSVASRCSDLLEATVIHKFEASSPSLDPYLVIDEYCNRALCFIHRDISPPINFISSSGKWKYWSRRPSSSSLQPQMTRKRKRNRWKGSPFCASSRVSNRNDTHTHTP